MKVENASVERAQKEATLTNMILDYAIANKMAFDSVQQAVEDVKRAYLSDGLIRRD